MENIAKKSASGITIWKALLITLGIFIVLVIGLTAAVLIANNSSTTPPTGKEFHPTVSLYGDKVVFHSPYAVTGCTVGLNSGTLNLGKYKRDIDLLEGDTTIVLRAFTTSDGERFDPDTHAVKNIILNCAENPPVSYYFN